MYSEIIIFSSKHNLWLTNFFNNFNFLFSRCQNRAKQQSFISFYYQKCSVDTQCIKINEVLRIIFSRFAFDNLFITLMPNSYVDLSSFVFLSAHLIFFFKSNVSRWNKFQKNSVSKVDRPRRYYFPFLFFLFRILTSQKWGWISTHICIKKENTNTSDRGYCFFQ